MTAYTMTQRMLDAALCAYYVRPSGFQTVAKYWDPIGMVDTSVTPILAGLDNIDAAFVGTTDDNWAVLSLRGTISGDSSINAVVQGILDWGQDGESGLTDWTLCGDTVRVHHGFLNAMNRLWPQVETALAALDWSTLQGLQITGHSKGAALTSLFAAQVATRMSQVKEIVVNAYAMPLVGDADFVTWTNNCAVITSTTRYQRAYDIVPFAPIYDSWDVFSHLEMGWNWDSIKLYTLLETLSTLSGEGYHLIGDLVYYPGSDPATSSPLTGNEAVTHSHAAIIAAVKHGQGDTIAGAHSGLHSYWPAIFGKPNPASSSADLDGVVAAVLG